MFGLGVVRGSTRLALGLALAAGLVFAGCGSGTFEAGTPSGLGQTAPGGGTPPPGGGGGGGTPPPGGGGGTNNLEIVGLVNTLLPAFSQGQRGISLTAPQTAAGQDEVWLLVKNPPAGFNAQAATIEAFDPGTQTPAGAGSQPGTIGFLVLPGGVLFAFANFPPTSVDYVIDDQNGNVGTIAATFPVIASPNLTLSSPTDASTITTGTPTFVWNDSNTAASYFLFVLGTSDIFPNQLPWTGSSPVMVQVNAKQHVVASGSAMHAFSDVAIPLSNGSTGQFDDSWAWMVVALDANGWALETATFYFDLIRN